MIRIIDLSFRIILLNSIAVFILAMPKGTNAQDLTQVTFVEDLKEEARAQIKRILANYEVEDWIFTEEIKIVHNEDARSYPILQMNTNHLDDDTVQLSVFIHENAHIFVSDDKKDEAENKVIRKLRSLYPNPPEPMQKNLYHHIMVAWIEYDALIELFGKEKANSIMRRKINYYIKDDPNSLLYLNFLWYNNKAMNNPYIIGKIMDEYGFNINPQKGIIIQ